MHQEVVGDHIVVQQDWSWAAMLPWMLLVALGVVAAVVMLVLLWRAGKGGGVGTLILVTLGVATILFFLTRLHLRPGQVEAGQEYHVPYWAIGMRAFAMVLCGMVVGSIVVLVLRFFSWLGAADPAGGAVNTEERKRILGMVEQGKMTGAEGADLLDALGKSSALRGEQTFGRLDVALLVAMAVVTLGFFLPWVYLSDSAAMIAAGLVAAGAPVYQSGYQVGPAGWAVLVSAILAALLVFITPKGYLYKLALLQVLSICVGLALTVSVWWNAGTGVRAGAVICTLGFGFALIASGMKLKALGR
jgi:hypothetical protein